jgi:regulatory protein
VSRTDSEAARSTGWGRGRRRSSSRGFGGPEVDREEDVDEEGTDPEGVARTICLRLLTAAPKTRAQLEEALRRRGVPRAAANRVLDRLVELRLVDDSAFAASWVESRHAGRGLAPRALRSELRHLGVADDVVSSAVARIQPEDEMAAARSLVARRIGSTRGLPYVARVRRLAGLLARKGYPAGLAMHVVREALRDDATAHLDDVGEEELLLEDEPEAGLDEGPGAVASQILSP